MKLPRLYAFSTLALGALCAPHAAAQVVANSRFEAGLAQWTVTPTLAGSVGAPGATAVVDMDGPGPLLAGPAARFTVGKLPGTSGPNYHGVLLSQTVELEAGREYAFRLDWSTTNSASTTANGGRYSLLVPGVLVETVLVGGVPAGGLRAGVLEDTFVAPVGGPTEIQVRIDSTATVPAPPILEHRVDNVRLESGFRSSPGFLPVAGGGVESLELDAGPGRAFEGYLILGSLGGSVPGVDLPADVHLPVVPDAYTNVILGGLGAPPFAGFAGVLDGQGRATTSFALPSGLSPAAVGLELTHAFVSFDAAAVTFASNADSILLF